MYDFDLFYAVNTVLNVRCKRNPGLIDTGTYNGESFQYLGSDQCIYAPASTDWFKQNEYGRPEDTQAKHPLSTIFGSEPSARNLGDHVSVEEWAEHKA